MDPVLAGDAKWGDGGVNAFCSTPPWLKPEKQPMWQRNPEKTIVLWQMCQQMSWLEAGKEVPLHTKAFSSGWLQRPVCTVRKEIVATDLLHFWQYHPPQNAVLCQRCVGKCISLTFTVFLHYTIYNMCCLILGHAPWSRKWCIWWSLCFPAKADNLLELLFHCSGLLQKSVSPPIS